MEYLDLKGMTCPQPVIETKKLVESRHISELNLLVDNGPPRENVTRFLQSQGYYVTVDVEQADGILLHAKRAKGAETAAVPPEKKIVVLIDAASVGRGDDRLGAVLMKSFLYTLKEIQPLPWRIIFINAGVKLAVEGSDLTGLLGELEALGIDILSCGTCLDFFNVKEKLIAGKVSNMYEIVTSLVAATNVLRP